MVKALDKKTLTRLYVKEKLSLRAIAKMYDRSYCFARARSIKYGIKTRHRGLDRKIRIEKSILQKLYVKEGKSSMEVAEILSCSYTTVLNRCKEYGISIKAQRFEKITKEVLQNLYVKEGRTIREVAKILGCSFETVRVKCKRFGIPLRNPGNEKVVIDTLTLQRLYIQEGKNKDEIAKIFGCSASSIYQLVKRFDLNNDSQQASQWRGLKYFTPL